MKHTDITLFFNIYTPITETPKISTIARMIKENPFKNFSIHLGNNVILFISSHVTFSITDNLDIQFSYFVNEELNKEEINEVIEIELIPMYIKLMRTLDLKHVIDTNCETMIKINNLDYVFKRQKNKRHE